MRERIGPERFFSISYESLTSEAERSMRLLCKFLGVRFNPSMLEFYKSDEARRAAESSELWGNVVKPIMEGRADFVNASRLVYSMEAGAMKWFHVPVNHLFAFLVGLLVGARLTDSLCGFKAFRKSMLFEHLQEDGWPDFEMLIQAGRNGMRVVEVPTHYMARRKGASKMKSFRHGFAMLLMLLKAVFE